MLSFRTPLFTVSCLLSAAYCILSTITPSPLFAADCNSAPEYEGPYYPYLFDSQMADCGVSTERTQAWNDFIDHAIVTCLDEPHLDPRLNPGSRLDFILPWGQSATVDLGSLHIANIAVDSPTLEENYNELARYLANVSLTNQLSDADFAGACLKLNLPDRDQCAQALGLTIELPTGSYPNTFLVSTPDQRQTTIDDLIAYRRARAKQILTCTQSSTPPGNILCDNIYCADDGCRTTSKDIANTVLGVHSYQDYLNLSDDDRDKFNSLAPIKAAQHLYQVVVMKPSDSKYTYSLKQANTNPGIIIGDDQDIIIGHGSIPMLPAVFNAAVRKVQRLTPLKESETLVEKLRAATLNPVDHNLSVEKQIKAKIQQANLSCTKPPTPTQFLGGVEANRSAAISLSWLFNILGEISQSLQTPQQPYTAYRLEPFELYALDQIYGEGDISFMRKINPQVTIPDVGLPDPLPGESLSAQTHTKQPTPCPTPIPGTTPSSACTNEAVSPITYAGSTRSSFDINNGGQGSQSINYNNHSKGIPLDSPQNSREACNFYQWLSGSILFNITQALDIPTAFLAGGPCPGKLTPPTNPGLCDNVPRPVENPNNCSLCHSWMDSMIPPALKNLVEAAAAKYSVPPSLILGHMYAEGGFMSRCAGPSGYTDSDITNCQISQCKHCNVYQGVDGGPFGWMTSTIDDAHVASSNRFRCIQRTSFSAR